MAKPCSLSAMLRTALVLVLVRHDAALRRVTAPFSKGDVLFIWPQAALGHMKNAPHAQSTDGAPELVIVHSEDEVAGTIRVRAMDVDAGAERIFEVPKAWSIIKRYQPYGCRELHISAWFVDHLDDLAFLTVEGQHAFIEFWADVGRKFAEVQHRGLIPAEEVKDDPWGEFSDLAFAISGAFDFSERHHPIDKFQAMEAPRLPRFALKLWERKGIISPTALARFDEQHDIMGSVVVGQEQMRMHKKNMAMFKKALSNRSRADGAPCVPRLLPARDELPHGGLLRLDMGGMVMTFGDD